MRPSIDVASRDVASRGQPICLCGRSLSSYERMREGTWRAHARHRRSGPGSPIVTARPGLYRRVGKRALDLLVSILAAVLLSPLLAVIALMVKRDLGSPILFRQVRPGENGKPFTILKFRSMTVVRDP